jgi:hypothetical protein
MLSSRGGVKAGTPPTGHTRRSRVTPTAEGPRPSLTDEGRLTPCFTCQVGYNTKSSASIFNASGMHAAKLPCKLECAHGTLMHATCHA